jgi:hypothetical protein
VLILIALTAPVAPACSANPMSELEALGYLQMALQQPLGTGFASTVKVLARDELVPRARPGGRARGCSPDPTWRATSAGTIRRLCVRSSKHIAGPIASF